MSFPEAFPEAFPDASATSASTQRSNASGRRAVRYPGRGVAASSDESVSYSLPYSLLELGSGFINLKKVQRSLCFEAWLLAPWGVQMKRLWQRWPLC